MSKKSKRPTQYTMIVRAKGMYDGCINIDEMISRLHSQAHYLAGLRDVGATMLYSPVVDDYAFLSTTDSKAAKKYGFEKEEE